MLVKPRPLPVSSPCIGCASKWPRVIRTKEKDEALAKSRFAHRLCEVDTRVMHVVSQEAIATIDDPEIVGAASALAEIDPTANVADFLDAHKKK